MLNSVSKKIFFLLCCFGTILSSCFAEDGKPFIDPGSISDELRVYYQNWLVVCANKGQGVCRMVNPKFKKLDSVEDHEFGDSELTIYPASQWPRMPNTFDYNDVAAIEFYKSGLPALQGPVSVAIDGKTIVELQPSVQRQPSAGKSSSPQRKARSQHYVFDSSCKFLAEETYRIEGDAADRILDKIENGRWLSISYLENNTQKTEKFSLRGVVKSLAFIRDTVREHPSGVSEPTVIATDVQFKSGTSSAAYTGEAKYGKRYVYKLRAKQGQQMNIGLVSTDKNFLFDLIDPDGCTVTGGGYPESKWTVPLAKTGQYSIIGVMVNDSYEKMDDEYKKIVSFDLAVEIK